jgi:hypothetical protein
MDTALTTRTAALANLSRSDVAFIAEKAQGRNELRALLKVGGIHGRAVSAESEKQAAAALEGLRDGWYAGPDASAYYAGAELAMYCAARERALAVAA